MSSSSATFSRHPYNPPSPLSPALEVLGGPMVLGVLMML